MTASDLPTPNPDSAITDRTVITGAEFRAFYLDNWPSRDWCIEDCEYEIEDEEGRFILPDDARVRLGRLGYLAWQGSESVRDHGAMYPLTDFYRAYAEHNTKQVSLVTIEAEHQEALEEFVRSIGGSIHPAQLSRAVDTPIEAPSPASPR